MEPMNFHIGDNCADVFSRGLFKTTIVIQGAGSKYVLNLHHETLREDRSKFD